MGNATPCSDWDTTELLAHTFGVVAGISRALRREDPPADGGAVVMGADPAAEFRALADRTLDAWQNTRLDDEVDIGAGPMPGRAALGINLIDTATHAWDIARATGQPAELPEELAAVVLGICHGFVTDEIRGFAGFHPAVDVADDADSTTKLVAFLGRNP
jgi:uncharacterized protein (TIGR03086 family)